MAVACRDIRKVFLTVTVIGWDRGRSVKRLTDEEKERFLSRVSEPDENGCRVWLGRRDKDGYGLFDIRRGKRDDGKEAKYALRCNIVAWEIEYDEEFPKGHFACHTCDNPPCCNARDHIYPGTPSDNMVDREVRGRANRKGGGTKEGGKEKRKGMVRRTNIEIMLDRVLKEKK